MQEDLGRRPAVRGSGEFAAIEALCVFSPSAHEAVNPESRRRQ
jgi:hypothetical protein